MSGENLSLAMEWRRLRRAATLVALLTSPAVFLWLYQRIGWSLPLAALGAFASVVAFRGFIDVVFRRLLPWPSMYGADEELAQQDVIARRRVWTWRTRFRWLINLAIVGVLVMIGAYFFLWLVGVNVPFEKTFTALRGYMSQNAGQFLGLAFSLPMFFVVNVLIFLGPLMLWSADLAPDLLDPLIADVREGGDHRRIELATGVPDDLGTRTLERRCMAIGAVRRQRIERIGDGEHARRERDLFARQPVGVAAAVPALVV